MYAIADIEKFRETQDGTELIVHIKGARLANLIREKDIRHIEARFDDGRTISAEQRKKAHATIRDIAEYTGDTFDDLKGHMKMRHIERTGCKEFSLSDCSVDTAREFINTLMEFCIENGIPLSEQGIKRTDDINRYLYYCLKNKKCAVCGLDAEIHHVDTIGMGNDRKNVDDSNYRKIALCRKHHTIAHQRGIEAFEKMYKVYGIVESDQNGETKI